MGAARSTSLDPSKEEAIKIHKRNSRTTTLPGTDANYMYPCSEIYFSSYVHSMIYVNITGHQMTLSDSSGELEFSLDGGPNTIKGEARQSEVVEREVRRRGCRSGFGGRERQRQGGSRTDKATAEQQTTSDDLRRQGRKIG